MAALELDKLTWPEVERELRAGRDTVVIAFGATEQHALHMPLATDTLLGDAFAHRLGARLDAFVGPTVRVGCSSHHMAFPGTLRSPRRPSTRSSPTWSPRWWAPASGASS